MRDIKDRLQRKLNQKIYEISKRFQQFAHDSSGLTVVEMILILVVLIALVLIFKTQLISLVNSIFQKITSESSGI